MKNIEQSLSALRQRIAQYAQSWQRDPEDIHILAVSKRQPVSAIEAALAAGQIDFGENYLQEAQTKMETLAGKGIHWHFIGPLQANKTRLVAENFDWVHSLDRVKIARRLSAQRPAEQPPLQVCIQVNISGEATKTGISPAGLPQLAEAVAGLPGLRLRGLMTLPAPADNLEDQRRPFAALRAALEDLNARGHGLDTLSMGTSADLEAAVAEGTTLVRTGTALFGPRPD